MATGRTLQRWTRVFINGYDLSGYTVKIGPLENSYAPADLTTIADAVKGALPGQGSAKCGTLNGVFDNTATSGLHVLSSAQAGEKRLVTTCLGIRAEPAVGDPCFTVEASQLGYGEVDTGGAMTVSVPFGEWSSSASSLLYARAWGRILNANTTRTGANSATGGVDNGAASTTGGYMIYHITTGDGGNATISIDDSANDSAYSALSGATTGNIAMTTGVSGIVALSPTATVRRYLRWQLTLDTSVIVTFVLAFVRG